VPPTAWVASASDIEAAADLGLLRTARKEEEYIFAAEARIEPPIASCSLSLYSSPKGLARAFNQPVETFGLDPNSSYCFLDGFTAPVGERWRDYVRVLTATALQRARERGAGCVVIDVYELGNSTQAVLQALDFVALRDHHRLWVYALGQ
jgi:hypothetical protein